MVNFNNDNTLTTAPQNVIKIMILERWNNVLESIEHYQLNINRGIKQDPSYIRARLLSLFNILYGILKRDFKAGQLKEYSDIINRGDIESLLNLYYNLTEFLDKKQLIKIDTKKQYDTTDIEEENEIKGL